MTVLSFNFDNSTVSGYVDRKNSVIGHKAFCRCKLFYDPFAKANVIEEENAFCIRLSCEYSSLLSEFGFILGKESEQSAFDRFSVFVNLVALDIATDELVLEGDVDDFAFSLDIDIDRSLAQHITCGRYELTNNPLTEANVFKAEFTFRVRLGYEHCVFFSKLCGVRLKQTELRAGNDVAVFVQFETFDVTTDITVFEFDFYNVAVFLDGCLLYTSPSPRD